MSLVALIGCASSYIASESQSTFSATPEANCSNLEIAASDLKREIVSANILEGNSGGREVTGIEVLNTEYSNRFNFIEKKATRLTGKCVLRLDNVQLSNLLRHRQTEIPNPTSYVDYGMYIKPSDPHPSNIEGNFIGADRLCQTTSNKLVFLGFWEQNGATIIGFYTTDRARNVSSATPIFRASTSMRFLEVLPPIHVGMGGTVWLYQETENGILMYIWAYNFSSIE